MLTSAKKAEIERLIAEGELSEREIAEEAEVARGTVRRVKVGQVVRTKPGGETGRCRTCGTDGVLPCPVCSLRGELEIE
jgi:hypothetical protein